MSTRRTLSPSFVCCGCRQRIVRALPPTRDIRTHYCCLGCKMWAFNHKENPAVRVPRRRRESREPKPFPICLICGSACSRRDAKTCSSVCSEERNRRLAREQHALAFPLRARDITCINPRCRKVFSYTFREGDGRAKYCSLRCSKRHHRRGQNHPESRARRAGVPYVYGIKPEQVFERDGWRCQLCGCKTPKRLRGKNKLTSPELDHIIPFAAGGGHTWDNVQCACRRCNGKKNASPRGQLRLSI